VLECAAKKRKPVFVASTSEVYGKNVNIPFCEDDDITPGRQYSVLAGLTPLQAPG